jgi:hypothetical protein
VTPILEVIRLIGDSALLEGHGQAGRLPCGFDRPPEIGSKIIEGVDVRGRIVDPIP